MDSWDDRNGAPRGHGAARHLSRAVAERERGRRRLNATTATVGVASLLAAGAVAAALPGSTHKTTSSSGSTSTGTSSSGTGASSGGSANSGSGASTGSSSNSPSPSNSSGSSNSSSSSNNLQAPVNQPVQSN